MIMMVDTYIGMAAKCKDIKAGTEEINFFSETGTYNRDNIPCIEFHIPDEFLIFIDRMIDTFKNIGM